MKKSILIYLSSICFLLTSIVGCKKDFQEKEKNNASELNQTVESHSSNQSSNFMENISVSEYGFLIFPELTHFTDYQMFVLNSTHSEVQEYLTSINFNSLGATIYGEEYYSERVTEEQLVNYMFNSSKVFQVKNAIIKPINETNEEVKWEFILVMTPEYLSNASYENLAAGIFDANTMNKFATNPNDETLAMFEFIEETPYGYEEATANSAQAFRPMFGHGSWINTTCVLEPENNWVDQDGDGDTDPTYYRCRKRMTYVFWIGIGYDDDCYIATGCN